MNQSEQEAVILNTVWGMIDDMVNWTMFDDFGEDGPTSLSFRTGSHARLFIVLLADFLSMVQASKGRAVPLGLPKVPENARPSDRTFLYYLKHVCADPQLGEQALPMAERVDAFADWLEGTFTACSVNLPDIDLVGDVTVERYRYLKMCGDIAKHSLPRLAVNVRRLRRLLQKSGHEVDEEQAYLAMDNFFDWFFDDSFAYSASRIAEFLNELRWSIFEYLRPEYERAFQLEGILYRYNVPENIKEPIGRAMYWDLMNRVGTKPIVPRFEVTEYLKRRH